MSERAVLLLTQTWLQLLILFGAVGQPEQSCLPWKVWLGTARLDMFFVTLGAIGASEGDFGDPGTTLETCGSTLGALGLTLGAFGVMWRPFGPLWDLIWEPLG